MTDVATVVIECDDETVRRQFEGLLGSCAEFRIRSSRGHYPPDLVILEFSERDPQQTFSSIKGILSCEPHTEVFLTARQLDPHVILEAFRMGAKEFLPQPIAESDLEAAVGRFLERFRSRPPSSGPKLATVISVIGAKGGAGASTVAVNLAVCAGQVTPGVSPTLVDLNFYDDELSIFLDAKTPRGLRDLSGDISRLDETMLESVLARHESGVRLLSSGGYDELMGGRPARGCVARVVQLLRGMSPCVFVDVGHILEPAVKEALGVSTTILVVTTLSVPAIRRAKQLMDLLGSSEYGHVKVELVVNRYHASDAELLRQTEDVLQKKAAWLIPVDDLAANGSLNKGVPLTAFAPKAAITKEFVKQAAELCGNSRGRATDKKSGVLARWFPSLIGNAASHSS